MTTEQIDALRKLESFGWSLNMVRRPKFEPVEVLLMHADGKSVAILTESGELDHKTSPKLRGEIILPEVDEEGGDPWSNASDDMEFEVNEGSAPGPQPTPTINKEPVPTSTRGGVTKSNKKPPKDVLV
ncbi:MAG: hypothetical protein ABJ308_05495 [Halieaceae bacterium]